MATKQQKIDWTPLFKYLDSNFASKKDLARIEKKIAFLPTRDQFYEKMDNWMRAASTQDLERAAHRLDHQLLHSHLTSPHIL